MLYVSHQSVQSVYKKIRRIIRIQREYSVVFLNISSISMYMSIEWWIYSNITRADRIRTVWQSTTNYYIHTCLNLLRLSYRFLLWSLEEPHPHETPKVSSKGRRIPQYFNIYACMHMSMYLCSIEIWYLVLSACIYMNTWEKDKWWILSIAARPPVFLTFPPKFLLSNERTKGGERNWNTKPQTGTHFWLALLA